MNDQPTGMGVPSLVSIAQRVAGKNIDDIQGFGDAPMRLIQPILVKVRRPDQLREMEAESPHIIGSDTVRLWKKFIARDIPNGDKNQLEPKNIASWWKVYRKLKREEEKKERLAQEQLRDSLQKHEAKRESNKATLLNCVLPGQKEKGLWLQKGVTSKNLGRNAMTALLKNDNGPRSPVRPTVQAPLGKVTAAPPQMVNQYLRLNGKAPVTASPHATPLRGIIRRPQMVFQKARKVASTPDQQALALALRKDHLGTNAKPTPAPVRGLSRSAPESSVKRKVPQHEGEPRKEVASAAPRARSPSASNSKPRPAAPRSISPPASSSKPGPAAPVVEVRIPRAPENRVKHRDAQHGDTTSSTSSAPSKRNETQRAITPSGTEVNPATRAESPPATASQPKPITQGIKRKAPAPPSIFMAKKPKRA